MFGAQSRPPLTMLRSPLSFYQRCRAHRADERQPRRHPQHRPIPDDK